jgi:hypothetical protein
MFAPLVTILVKKSREIALAAALAAAVARGGEETFAWGVNGHPLSQAAYFDVSLSAQLGLVCDLEAGWYRIDLGEGSFAALTSRLDELLTAAAGRRVRLLPVLIPSLGAAAAGAEPEAVRAGAFAFARMVAARYRGRITHWELGNELDAVALLRRGDTTRAGTAWTWGDPDGSREEDYDDRRYGRAMAEIRGLAEGIKAADPQATTVVGTAGWLHYGFIARLVNEDRVPFDVLAWHWYSEMGDMTRVQGKLDLLARLARFGKPLWLTETNRRDGSLGGREGEEARYISADLARLRADPRVGGIFAYELLDEPYFGESGESHYGLAEVERGPDGRWAVGRRKPAFLSFRALAAADQAPR